MGHLSCSIKLCILYIVWCYAMKVGLGFHGWHSRIYVVLEFVRLSIASAVMLCLEIWYFDHEYDASHWKPK